jgi:hypothetical protein
VGVGGGASRGPREDLGGEGDVVSRAFFLEAQLAVVVAAPDDYSRVLQEGDSVALATSKGDDVLVVERFLIQSLGKERGRDNSRKIGREKRETS